jgi:hypothetical protein
MLNYRHVDLLSQHARVTLLFLTPGEQRSLHIQSAFRTVETTVVKRFK